MNRSTPGLPVHHQLPEFTQTHEQLHSSLFKKSDFQTLIRGHHDWGRDGGTGWLTTSSGKQNLWGFCHRKITLPVHTFWFFKIKLTAAFDIISSPDKYLRANYDNTATIYCEFASTIHHFNCFNYETNTSTIVPFLWMGELRHRKASGYWPEVCQ